MFQQTISRLLGHTVPIELQFSHCCRHKGPLYQHVEAIMCGKFMQRRILSTVCESSLEKEKDNERQPRSLILQKLLDSKRLKSSEDIDHKRGATNPVQDLSSRLERLSKDMQVKSNEIVCHDQEKLLPAFQVEKGIPKVGGGDTDYKNFIEDIVLQQDMQSIPKPSPLLGTEDQKVAPSKIPCVGCGANLQCQHRTVPGFMPSERFKLLSESELKSSICQRCHYIQHCDAFVEVTTNAQDYANIISQIKPTRSLVVMVVDVMDIQGSIIPNLSDYIGHKHPVLVVGNKVDLIAPDNSEYLVRIKESVRKSCQEAGIRNLRKVTLISAKTGFGVERLIDSLLSFYQKNVDVFIVGTANAGKSSLFNILLASDYCRQRARDLIQRATVSVWPGTTLNLLKFPIMRPTPRTVHLRHKRLKQEKAIQRELLKKEKQKKKMREKGAKWELKEEVRTTDIRTQVQVVSDEAGKPWGQEVFAFKGGENVLSPPPAHNFKETFDDTLYTNSYWMYDTPGVINPEQTFNLLEPEECGPLQPVTPITPQCVLFKPGMTIFISGLARLDYVKGDEAMIATIHSSHEVPIRVVALEEADQFYLQHFHSEDLRIPVGTPERWARLPSLVAREFEVEGQDDRLAVADVQLSSVGWVSLAPKEGCAATLRAYTPGRKGVSLRSPAMVPGYRAFMGKRVAQTPFFRTTVSGRTVVGKSLASDAE